MERLDENCDFVIPGFVNLYSVFSVVWFLVDMKPLEYNSKPFTVYLK